MYYSRTILTQINRFLDKQLAVLILGSRQTGKTVLLSFIRQEILDRQLAKEKQIQSLDLEKGSDLALLSEKTPEQFIEYLYAKTALPEKTPLWLFIDEIQYLTGASSFFKILIDHYPQIHLVMSGSSSLEIKKIFSDRLTGRKIAFVLPTLTFAEYLVFQEHTLSPSWQKINLSSILAGKTRGLKKYESLVSEILPSFEEFVIFGGYPRPSLKENRSIRVDLLAEIRDGYARRDVADILKIENVTGFNRLLGLLAAQIGNMVNFDELSNSANLNRQTLEKYLFLLEETFIINLIKPYHTNPRQELVKMPKVYFQDTGLRNLISEQIGPTVSLDLRPDKGALAENFIFHELNAARFPIRFWRTKTKAEVDFIISLPDSGQIPLEVKYQTMNKPEVPTGLAAFIKKYQPSYGFVGTKNFFGQTKYQSTLVYFIPIAFF